MMERTRLHPRFGKAKIILSCCAVVVLSICAFSSRHLAGAWRTNEQGLRTVEELQAKKSLDSDALASALKSPCLDFMAGSMVVSDDRLSLEQRMQLLETLAACWPPERTHFLVEKQIDTLWSLRRYTEACDEAVAVEGPDQLLSLALLSSESGNWEAVEISLVCVTRFETGKAWVSPFIVAQLYFGLGQHYELNGWIDKAIAAYDTAASKYPIVWAGPYLRKAALLEVHGRDEEVSHWLQDGLVKSSDATTAFTLWDALGDYWQRAGRLSDALCAYQAAARLIDYAPGQDLSTSQRAAFRSKINTLAGTTVAECSALSPRLKSVAERP